MSRDAARAAAPQLELGALRVWEDEFGRGDVDDLLGKRLDARLEVPDREVRVAELLRLATYRCQPAVAVGSEVGLLPVGLERPLVGRSKRLVVGALDVQRDRKVDRLEVVRVVRDDQELERDCGLRA